MNKEKYQIGDNYRNFRPITRAADYSHWQITRTLKQKKIVDSCKVPSLFLLPWNPLACN